MASDPCGSHVIEKFIMAEGIKEKHKDALLNKLKVIFMSQHRLRKKFECKNENLFLLISFNI